MSESTKPNLMPNRRSSRRSELNDQVEIGSPVSGSNSESAMPFDASITVTCGKPPIGSMKRHNASCPGTQYVLYVCE